MIGWSGDPGNAGRTRWGAGKLGCVPQAFSVAGAGVVVPAGDTIYGADAGMDVLSSVDELYAEIYAESPYNEGPADVADFASGRSQRISQHNFRLVVAAHMVAWVNSELMKNTAEIGQLRLLRAASRG